MVKGTKENTKMIRNKEQVSSFGQMEECMLDNGKMANNTEMENIHIKMARPKKVIGFMERDKTGSKTM